MGLMQKLYETYESNSHMVGAVVQDKSVLLPAFHSSVSVQIEITLTPDGEFYSAVSVPKERAATTVPSTEEASGRTAAVASYPFSDQLKYVAPSQATAADAETYKAHHENFLENLCAWAQSPQAHYKVVSVCNYCNSGTIVDDLAGSGVVNLSSDGHYAVGKVEGKPCETAVVRWIVLPVENDNNPGETWLDQSMIQNYIEYMTGKQGDKDCDYCYITGKMAPVAHNHAKGIVKNVYGAKLVSANDSSGFTYRGRFNSSSEAVAVSDEASQKAHSALKWIISNQGDIIGGRTFVCWNPKGKAVPKVSKYSMLSYKEEKPDYPLTMPVYKQQLFKALNGYNDVLDERDDVVILSLEAATLGRLSVTYFNELKASDFLNRLKIWNETCCWYMIGKAEKGNIHYIGSPSIRNIIECAFGNEYENYIKADDGIYKEYTQLLLSCIVDASRIPQTVVQALVRKASAPQSYKQYYTRERVLSVACAIIRKYINDKNGKEDWSMMIDDNCTDRSFLFGMLLAVAEKVETSTYSSKDWRESNAMKLQSEFCRHPFSTWGNLEKALEPYYKRLNSGSYEKYKNLTASIVEKFPDKSMQKLNMPLEPTYLLGYYLQRIEFNKDNKQGEEK